MRIRNRIGFHFGSQANAQGWGDYVRTLDAAGIPAVLMSTGGEGLGDIIGCWQNGSTVEHVAVVRCLTHNDVPLRGSPISEAVTDWLNRYVPKIGQDVKDYHRRVITKHGNELDKNQIQWLADFYTALHPALLERMGWASHRICVFNFAAGEPEYGDWESIVPFLRLAGDNPDKFVIGVHEYSYNDTDIFSGSPYLVGRCWSHLMDVCDAHGIQRPYVAIHEFGWRDTSIRQPTADAVGQVNAAMREYAAHLGDKFIGAGIWTLQEWQGSGINNEVQKLIEPIKQMTLNNWYETGDPVTPPPPKHKAIIVKLPQSMTEAEWLDACKVAYSFRHTVTASHDDMMIALHGGDADSYVKFSHPERDAAAVEMVEAAGYSWQPLYDAPPAGFEFTHWPTDYKVVTQAWGNNPEYYAQFGLPGHEGVDIRALHATPVYAVASGQVSQVNTNPAASNYGIYVRLSHAQSYETTYAHLDRTAVNAGTWVQAGDIIGYADNTGNSFGSHLHLTLKRIGYTYTDDLGTWPYNIFDPTPHLETFSGVTWPNDPPPPAAIDLLPYLRGDGRLYEVRHPSGSQERFQTQSDGTTFYLVKNSQYETLHYDDTYIWRSVDTSPGAAPADAERPGAARWYTQFEAGNDKARWCKRFMVPGETFTGSGHAVRFYYKSDCDPSAINSGRATNRVTFVTRLDSATWNGVTVQDVVELTNGTERFWFARGFGLVAWSSQWGASAISEIHAPGTRPDNVKESGCWS